jgi:hypothetical protein
VRALLVARKLNKIEERHHYQNCFEEEIAGRKATTQKDSYVRDPVKMPSVVRKLSTKKNNSAKTTVLFRREDYRNKDHNPPQKKICPGFESR